MAYIWINPVTDSMYEPDVLNTFLHHHGYKRFYTSGDWLTIVKQKYLSVVEQTSYPVMDVRCPKVKELLDEVDMSSDTMSSDIVSSDVVSSDLVSPDIAASDITISDITIPEIQPILIHCGIEGSEREDLRSEEKIITTPCRALADMGNALKLKNTRFVPWNQFIELAGSDSISIEPLGTPLEKSPIPPGFFAELGLRTVSLTGEEEIRKYFKKPTRDEVQIVEMLFCKDGCHNGDGIRKYEK